MVLSYKRILIVNIVLFLLATSFISWLIFAKTIAVISTSIVVCISILIQIVVYRRIKQNIKEEYARKESIEFLGLLKSYNIDLVLDVGANIGQTANFFLRSDYKGKLVSFEPLSSAYERLKKMSKNNPNWEIAEKCAIGDRDGEIEINISNNSQSSSVLPMLKNHIEAVPDSFYVGTEKVKLFRLDTIAPQYTRNSHAVFLKIDVQGFEENVLDGCSEIMPKIKGIQIELSFIPLYEGQKLFIDLFEKIQKMGFDLYKLLPVVLDRKGRILQADCIFFREK